MRTSVAAAAVALVIATFVAGFGVAIVVEGRGGPGWDFNGYLIAHALALALAAIGLLPVILARRSGRLGRSGPGAVSIDLLVAVLLAFSLAGLILRGANPFDPGLKGVAIAAVLMPSCYMASLAVRRGWSSIETSRSADAYAAFRIALVAAWGIVGTAERDYKPTDWGPGDVAAAAMLLTVGTAFGYAIRRRRLPHGGAMPSGGRPL